MAQAEVTKEVPVNAQKFFQAIRDYTKYPEFVEGMRSVKLIEKKSDTECRVAYEVSMMSKDLSYVIDLKEDPTALKLNWTLVKSEFFKKNDGAWSIKEKGPNACEVTYSLDIDFSFMVPGFILKNIVKVSLPSMIDSFANRAKGLK